MRKGLRPGPYELGAETLSDLPVLVYPVNEEHETVVVGRFPFTKKYDAYAHAVAYTALPDLMAALRRSISVQESLISEHAARDLSSDQVLREIASDGTNAPRAREMAEAVLQGREALRKAEKH